MTNKKIMRLIKKWLKEPENNKSKLSRILGYKSTSTVKNWMARESVPEYRWEELLKHIGEK